MAYSRVDVLGVPVEQAVYTREEIGDQVVVSSGGRILFNYTAGDQAMRNFAVVALANTRMKIRNVATLFDITPEYVYTLRKHAAEQGSAGLFPTRGRPPALTPSQAERARRWAAEGMPKPEIAERLKVHRSTVYRLLGAGEASHATATQPALEFTPDEPETETTARPDTETPDPRETPEQPDTDTEATEAPEDQPEQPAAPPPAKTTAAPAPAEPRTTAPETPPAPGPAIYSRYAGATLLHAFFDRVGLADICAGTDIPTNPTRGYPDLAVLTAATIAFALGAPTVESIKHLHRADVGAAVGLPAIPELKTLRERLAAYADTCDPVGMQRALATGLLATTSVPTSSETAPDATDTDDTDPVYFADDHFTPYYGKQPVAKGWNTKRGRAQKGRVDTLVTDLAGRPVVFCPGEPSGLSVTLPPALAELRAVVGPDAKILLGFDRGGAYPKTYAHCRDDNTDWLSYRRGKLAPTTGTPTPHQLTVDGRTHHYQLTDETVTLKDYGTARQITLWENDRPVIQILTSDTTTSAARLVHLLRCRWRIENTFKYLAHHYGIDTLADYHMTVAPDASLVKNPERVAARTQLKTAEKDLAAAEHALADLIHGPGTVTEKNRRLPAAEKAVAQAAAAVAEAKKALKPIPAKVPVTDLDPTATRARPHPHRRSLQMVLRLLAYNAEDWLAEHLDTHLDDPDEHRAHTRNLFHLGGHLTHTENQVTVTLDPPDSPRLRHALDHLLAELNTRPAHIPGDPRPLIYTIKN